MRGKKRLDTNYSTGDFESALFAGDEQNAVSGPPYSCAPEVIRSSGKLSPSVPKLSSRLLFLFLFAFVYYFTFVSLFFTMKTHISNLEGYMEYWGDAV